MTPRAQSTTAQAGPTALLAVSLVPGRLELLIRRAGLVAPVRHLDSLPPCFTPTPDTLTLLDCAGLPPGRLAQLLTRLTVRQRGPHARVVGLVEVGATAAPALLACAGAPCLRPHELAQVANTLDHLVPIAAPRPGLSLPFLEVFAALSSASSSAEAAARCGRSKSSYNQILSQARLALDLPSRRGSRPEELAAEILDALEHLALPQTAEQIAPA